MRDFAMGEGYRKRPITKSKQWPLTSSGNVTLVIVIIAGLLLLIAMAR